MSKGFLATLVAIVVILGGIFWFSRDTAESPAGTNDPSVAATSHTVGEGTAGVTLLEYGDFQCPACAGYYPIIQAVKDQYGDQITFQFRHFPLTQIHPNAMAAHRAAEAAGNQGKFFEMHDLLYERQESWTRISNAVGVFEGYAEELGLDMDAYRSYANSSEAAATINADLRAGQQQGVQSTPTFVINGKTVEENPRNFEEFKALIDDAIATQTNQ